MKPRLLLVEDDATTRAFLYSAMQPLDVDVDQASSMHQALALTAGAPHAAWLLDARLPDGNGVELLAQLRQSSPCVPALAHTAMADAAELQRLRDAGFNVAVSKPLPATDWQAAVRLLLACIPAPSPTIALWDDAAALKILGGNPEDLDALRGLFVHDLPDQIKALECAQTDRDIPTIKAELHRLSASCGFVGAARLAASISLWRKQPETLDAVLKAAQETLAAFPGGNPGIV